MINHRQRQGVAWTVILALALCWTGLAQTTVESDESVPSALPTISESPLELTHANFQENVGTGVWWIKYFSPYCHHCTSFAPTWAKIHRELGPELAEPREGQNQSQLQFGDVNCVTEADLCSKMGVRAYPAVILYNNGVEVDHLKGAQKEKFLKKYIRDQLDLISKQPVSGGAFPSFPTSEDSVHDVYPGSFTQTDDDQEVLAEQEPNTLGRSVALTYKEFNRRVTATRDSWFIQFYSPKSAYSRDIRPAWSQLSQQAKGLLNIGEVNCDEEKQLCKDAGVSQMPMLKFFASSIHSEYKGLRGLGDLLQFLDRAVEARKPRQIGMKEFTAMRKSTDNEVTLLYLYDRTTAKEDFQALEKLGVSMVGTVNIAQSNDTKVAKELGATQFPALYAVSADKVVQYIAKSPHQIRDHAKLVEWTRANRAPLVPQLTPFNYEDVFKQQVVVLAILDPRDPDTTSAAIKELTACAKELQDILRKEEAEELLELRKKKQLKIDEAKDKDDKKAENAANKIKVEVSKRQPVGVAWIDAVFWERWIKSRYGSSPGGGFDARVVINHESAGVYWDRTLSGATLSASRTQILETLEAVLKPSPKIRAVRLQNSLSSMVLRAQAVVSQHRVFTAAFCSVVVFAVWYQRHVRSRRGGDEAGGFGLLGKFD